MNDVETLFKRTQKQKEATKILANYFYSLLVGGSRSGKTFISVRSIIIRALKKKSKHLIVRLKFNHAKRSIWYNTLPAVMQICFPDLTYIKNNTDFFIRLPNGSEIWIAGVDSKERIEKVLGTEFSTIYLNESSQMTYEAFCILITRLSENSGLEMKCYLDLNPSTTKHFTYKLFYDGVNPANDKELPNKHLYGKLLMNPEDNQENLPATYISDILDSLPERQKKRFKEGLYVNEVEGAIWSIDTISKCRSVYKTFEEVIKNEEVINIALGVDPSTKAKPDSDLCGLILVINTRKKIYVCKDFSMRGSPAECAQKIIWIYDTFNVNFIVVETNQGGDMMKTILNGFGFLGKIIEVHASTSKMARAEPVEAMYERGAVEHLDNTELKYLEEEQTTWVPTESKKSPDRLDAAVWVLTHFAKDQDIVSKYDRINFNKLSKRFRTA